MDRGSKVKTNPSQARSRLMAAAELHLDKGPTLINRGWGTRKTGGSGRNVPGKERVKTGGDHATVVGAVFARLLQRAWRRCLDEASSQEHRQDCLCHQTLWKTFKLR